MRCQRKFAIRLSISFGNRGTSAPPLTTVVSICSDSQNNKLEKRNDAVVSGHQFFRNDTGAASRSDVHSRPRRAGRGGDGERRSGDDPGPSGTGAPVLRPVVYQVPLRITSIKTLGAPRWSRRSRRSPPLPGCQSRVYYFSANVAGDRRSLARG